MDNGPEEIGDQTMNAQIRRQARRVQLKSLLAALVLTTLALLLPNLP
jgi:hypothetical protein